MDEQKYIELFNDLASLVDKQFEYFESSATSDHDIATSLPALISLVNTIGYLRGQDGMFLNFRPHTEQQQYFYKTEDEFENRLRKLIVRVLKSNESEYYKSRLHEYYCKVRG